MGQDSKIEWSHHTFNPWRGCTKVSDGCKNCYADKLSHRNPKSLGVWGPSGTRVVAAESAWKEPLKWDRMAAAAGERHRVFCASMADVFEDWTGPMIGSDGRRLYRRANAGGEFWAGYDQPLSEVDARRLSGDELKIWHVRGRLIELIHRTPHLDWLLLTKRPENVTQLWDEAATECGEPGTLAMPLPNVWLGTSVENQKTADERIPHLLRCPAAVRFLSCEPLLGAVDLTRDPYPLAVYTEAKGCVYRDGFTGNTIGRGDGGFRKITREPGIGWVIVGGESGPGARPMHPAWARSIRDQCAAAGVPFFMKQWGQWGPGSVNMQTNEPVFREFANKQQWINKARTWVNGGTCVDVAGKVCRVGRDFDSAAYPIAIVHGLGKSAAGRLLDGVEHNAMPTAAGESTHA